jgi:hypothetical protein
MTFFIILCWALNINSIYFTYDQCGLLHPCVTVLRACRALFLGNTAKLVGAIEVAVLAAMGTARGQPAGTASL